MFTSESVSEGHPDKISDLISDTVVDLMINKDPYSRVACETLVTTNKVVIAGEYRLDIDKFKLFQEIEEKIRFAIKKIGYEQSGFHWERLEIENYLHDQSSDIAIGVDQNEGKEEGAGDQGLMFGYAVDETETYMPAPIYYSHLILKEMSDLRHSGKADFLGPDSKSQLSIQYDGSKPIGAKKIVVSTQHQEDYCQKDLRDFIIEVVNKVLPKEWFYNNDDILVNPTGRFVIGGPDGDTGLTGRKIIVDTYGGSAQHGGGAFSGKDPTKVDRSAAYMTRYLAKNVVASKLASKCSIQIAYAIGVSEPLSLYVNTFGTGKVDDQVIEKCIRKRVIEAKPSSPIEVLGLSGTPMAGDIANVVESESKAREVAEYRSRKLKEKEAALSSRGSVEQMLANIQSGEVTELPVIIKTDVHGSLEAIKVALNKLGDDKIKVKILAGSVGPINESDISLAVASSALVFGFNVRAVPQAREIAKRDMVEIRYHSIIYELIEDAKNGLSGMLDPDLQEEFIGYAEIKQVFNITNHGKIAGCSVTEGIIKRGCSFRLLRENKVVHEGKLQTLQRFKDEVKEVKFGLECGMGLENYNDIKVGDVMECFEVKEIKKTL